MIVNAGFIIGFDNETNQTAENMIQCIQNSGICMAMVGKLYALPKTQLTRRLKREGRLLSVNKFNPRILRMLKTVKAFLKVCIKAGCNKTTGWLYWKALLTVISKNPRAIEATVNLAAMFIHFYKQSKFIIDLTNNEIRSIESCGEEQYNHLMLQEVRNSNLA